MQSYQVKKELTNYSPSELRYYIHNLMLSLGIPGSLKGNRYLSYMVEQVYYDPHKIQNVMNGLYKETAKEYCTKVSNVERNCRTAIACIVKTEKYYDFCKRLDCFHYDDPTVRDLVALLGDALRRGLIEKQYLIMPIESHE